MDLQKDSLQNDLDHFNSLMPKVPVDRRSFIAAAVAAGFAVSAEPSLAQAVRTPMDGLEGGDVKIGDIPAYYAVKKGSGKRPVILVVPEIFGLHEYQKDMCRRLALAGYFAVSNDPFFRQGDLSKIADIKQVLAGANALSD
jgi:carboxymethylenebutenolidase